MSTFTIHRIDSRRGVTAPFVGDYHGKTPREAVSACLIHQAWIAGPELFTEGNTTEITRLNVREWKRDNDCLGVDEGYNQLVNPGDMLFRVESVILIVARSK